MSTPSSDREAAGLRAVLKRYWWPLAFVGILALAALVRVWLMARASWMLDGDEATMALVGRHIQLHHERPIYFPGQAYMGAWQSYVAAALFELFEMSRPVAKLVLLISASAFVATTMLLARRVYDRNVALLAGLFAALPSLYFISATLRISYPLIDVMTIGNVILLIAIDTAYRERLPQSFVWRCLVLGLLSGVAFWMHSAVAMYILPAALLLFLRFPLRSVVSGLPVALVGFLVGALPVFNQARQYDYTLFSYLLGSDADVAQRSYEKIAWHLVRHLLPRYLGTNVPWQDSSLLLNVLVGLPTVGAILLVLWHARRAPWQWLSIQRQAASPRNWLRTRPQASHPEFVLLLFGAVVLATYVLSRFSVYAIMFPSVDATGRYVAPIGSLLPLILASAAFRVARWGDAGTVVALALVAAVLSGTVVSYARSEPNQVFQSPYYRKLPPSSQQLVDVLDDMGVTEVWIDHWAGKPLMFDTRERIAATDYVDLRIWGGIDRLGAASRRVFASDNPAFVFVTTGMPDQHVPLEQTLNARGIPFESRYVSGYTIVHPLVQVDPASVVDDLIAAR